MNIFTNLKNNFSPPKPPESVIDINEFELYYTPAPAPTQKNLFFAHANGVPALTYKNFLQEIAQQFNMNVFSYDMRGIGKTRAKENKKQNKWAWEVLIHDHIALVQHLQSKFEGEWILAGHSMGAWISLLSSERLKIKDVWLFDPVILLPKTALQWSAAVLLKKRSLSPNGQKVRNRRLSYTSYEEAYLALQKRPFMKNWGKETIKNYIEGSFFQRENDVYLRHDPAWEATLFEEYFFGAWVGFLKVSRAYRKSLKPLFFVGANSDTCNPKSKWWVKLFFKDLKWHIIKEGGHMFPMNKQKETVECLKNALNLSTENRFPPPRE